MWQEMVGYRGKMRGYQKALVLGEELQDMCSSQDGGLIKKPPLAIMVSADKWASLLSSIIASARDRCTLIR